MPLSTPVFLAEHYELNHFKCSEPDLADWLKQRARANHASGASRVYICCEGTVFRVLLDFCVLRPSCRIAGEGTRNTPNPVLVILLGRLAVDASLEGKGLGRSLFKDATQRINAAAHTIGVSAIVVHLISEKARQFTSSWRL